MILRSLLTILIAFTLVVTAKSQVQEITATLDSIYQEDQKYRQQISEVMEEYGRDSQELQELFIKIVKTDSSNLKVVTEILDEKGWLGPDEVGKKASQTLFLVIQHADLSTQEKYLPMMKEAVESGKAAPQNFALLKDRVLLGQGKKQLYGSQIGMNQEAGEYYVKPLKAPEKVNERRKEMGLRPIEDYVSRWNIEWSVEAYNQSLEGINEN